MRETLFPDFRNFITGRGMAVCGDPVLLAVSGGLDSMVMTDLFSRIAGPMRLRVCVAHVNHGLRGADSDADEEFVSKAAVGYGFGFVARRARPRGKGNLQESARTLRRDALLDAARGFGAGRVFLAHNRGDQAETVLMHMVRGSGLDGLAGMRPISERGGVIFARPLLFASRERIERYARSRGVLHREDRSNRSTKYRRNEIRMRLMPMLARFNPRIEEALFRMAEGLAGESSVLDMIAEEGMREATVSGGDGLVALSAVEYCALPEAVRLRMLMRAWETASGSAAGLNSDQIRRMDSIAMSGAACGRYRLKAPYLFVKEGGLLRISVPADRA